ncbi:MAG: hypothetical protein ACREOI_20335 [bacterium]
MAKPRISYPENRKEVYRFWLGFFEKTTLILITVVVVPLVIGQLKYSNGLLILTTIIVLAFITVMIYLSRRLWYLPKPAKKTEE